MSQRALLSMKQKARKAGKRPSSSLSTMRVDPDLLQGAAGRLAEQLRGKSMKEAFKVLRSRDPARTSVVTTSEFRRCMERLGASVGPEDMETFETQFGEYAPDESLLHKHKRAIGAAATSTLPRRVQSARGVNYVKLLRRVYLEKLNPGTSGLVFSPMSTRKRHWGDRKAGADVLRVDHDAGRGAGGASGRSSATDAGLDVAPSWPHTIDLKREPATLSEDDLIYNKLKELQV